MMRFRLLLLLSFIAVFSFAQTPDSVNVQTPANPPRFSILVIPYNPMMHMSDADQDISEYSEKDIAQVRSIFRQGLVQQLNAKLITTYDTRVPERDFTEQDVNDLDQLYHSLYYERDTIYPIKYPKKDSTLLLKKVFRTKDHKPKPIDKTYMNVGMYDQQLLKDLARKYNVDMFVFLNEFDIKTNFNDCIDLAMKIYQRELKVHYTVFDSSGKQVYGDAAVAQFPSNSNDVNDIMTKNFPFISDYIQSSLNRH